MVLSPQRNVKFLDVIWEFKRGATINIPMQSLEKGVALM